MLMSFFPAFSFRDPVKTARRRAVPQSLCQRRWQALYFLALFLWVLPPVEGKADWKQDWEKTIEEAKKEGQLREETISSATGRNGWT